MDTEAANDRFQRSVVGAGDVRGRDPVSGPALFAGARVSE